MPLHLIRIETLRQWHQEGGGEGGGVRRWQGDLAVAPLLLLPCHPLHLTAAAS